MRAAATIADVVIGEDDFVLDTGTTVRGVWSGVSSSTTAVDGGPVLDVDATIVITLPEGMTRADLIGKIGTAKGERFRIQNADIGEVFTTLFLVHASQFHRR